MNSGPDMLDRQVKETLNAWAAEGQLPADRLDLLTVRVRERRSGPRALKAVLAAAALLLFMLTVPQVRVWAMGAASRLPLVGRFVSHLASRDAGWAWAQQHDAFQPVLAEAWDQGYTVRVHYVLADETQTGIVFTVEGPHPIESTSIVDTPMVRFNRAPFSVRSRLTSELIDGVYVGTLEVAALPDQRGTLTLTFPQLAGTTGHWSVTFSAEKGLRGVQSQTIQVHRDLQVGERVFSVDKVTLSPIQTMLVLHYQSLDPAPDLFGSGLMPQLLADGLPLEPRGPSCVGSPGAGEKTTMTCELTYRPAPSDTRALELEIPGLLIHDRIVTALPLQLGAEAQTPDGWKLELQDFSWEDNSGQALVTVAHDAHDPWRPYDDWYVVDDQGVKHPITPGLDRSPGARVGLRFSLTLPVGRKPVRLESGGAWRKIMGPWKLTIAVKH